MSVPVRFTPENYHACAACGELRRQESVKRKCKEKYPTDPEGKLQNDVDGCCYELAAAKALGVPWEGTVNTFKAPDVEGFQVRGSRFPRGHLIFRKGDAEDEAYVFVTGDGLVYEVHGWMSGWDLKQDKYWNEKNEFWWAPIEDLQPMGEIWRVTRRGDKDKTTGI